MLDKNPDLDSVQNLSNLIKILESKTLNMIMHTDSFLKTNFFNQLILGTNYPVIYLDLDLMFSGYVESSIMPINHRLTLYHPNRHQLPETIKKILLEISAKKNIIIIDSLNGLFNLYHDAKDAGRLLNSFIMLIGNISKNSNSSVIISGMTRRKNNEEWVLSITGRHIFASKQMNIIQLERKNSSFNVSLLDKKAVPQKTLSMQIQSNLI